MPTPLPPPCHPTQAFAPGETLPYWLVNVPQKDWPSACPSFLLDLSDKDKGILATRDEEYRDLSWEEVRDIVARNDLAAFQRRPSDLRRYRWYVAALQQNYGSVMAFILQERLRWENLIPVSPAPFQCPEDYKILRNDAPYGIDRRIVHLVVWTKAPFDNDPATGDLSTDGWNLIDAFVEEKFVRRVGIKDSVTWFKNPMALRSVRAIDHFHIMLFEPNEAFVRELTRGDVARSIEADIEGVDAYV